MRSSGQRSFSLQASTTGAGSLFLSVIIPLSILLNLSSKSFSFQKPFLQSRCPEIQMCVFVCVLNLENAYI